MVSRLELDPFTNTAATRRPCSMAALVGLGRDLSCERVLFCGSPFEAETVPPDRQVTTLPRGR